MSSGWRLRSRPRVNGTTQKVQKLSQPSMMPTQARMRLSRWISVSSGRRPTGSLVADRRGTATQFALLNLQERGSLFVGPGEEVYEGMIVGENARPDDMDVNATKEKKLSNIRQSTAEAFVRLIPKVELSLEQALELIGEDECVEVTPNHVRLRKTELSQQARVKAGRRRASSD